MNKKIKIAILSSYTINNIEIPLKSLLEKQGFSPEIKFGGYNQYNEELRNTSSWLYDFSPDIIFIAISSNTLFPEIEYKFQDDFEFVKKMVNEKTENLIKSLEKCTIPSKIILTSLDFPIYSPHGISDFKKQDGFYDLIQNANNLLRIFARENSKLILLNFDMICSKIGKDKITDHKMYYLGKVLLNNSSVKILSQEIMDCINVIYGNMKKCLIVDLDNTLWGGIVGEDGLEGIKIDNEGIGSIYKEIQQILLNFKKNGILLAIVSKNNPEDVEDVFSNKKEMILKKEDFACLKINWNKKSQNIKEISDELNLGLDSFVFLDDNPAERLEVSSILPMIELINFPEDISKLPSLLKESSYFKTLDLTEEDKTRNKMYLEEKKRTELQNKIDFKDYLKELEIKIKVEKDNLDSLDRISQLINKTNQFNLRTKRYTKEQVKDMILSDDYVVSNLKVWDKFGELGLTGVIILKKIGSGFFIDTFLLSCRILARSIENQFLIETLKLLPSNSIIFAEYIPTPKNLPAKDFYTNFGFQMIEKNNDTEIYKLQDLNLNNIDWIEVLNE